VTLSTCNRLELYLDVHRFHDAVETVTAMVAEAAGLATDDVGALLAVRVGSQVPAHLFAVAAGLDSIVVGEAEISGQVGSALRSAQQNRATTPSLNRLFQAAARTAKKVATETALGSAGRSVAGVALDLAADGTDLCRVMLVGTGALARVVAATLRARGCTELLVFSPSGRAAAFAERHQARVVTAADLPMAVASVGLVVACSGRDDQALNVDTVRRGLGRRDSVLPIIDLALHPDVSAGVRALEGVRVIDLAEVGAAVPPAHKEVVIAAEEIVATAAAAFEQDLAERSLDPAVIALRRHVSDAVAAELLRFGTNHDPTVTAELERAMRRLAQSLLHVPTVRARELARNGDEADYLHALSTLFGIDVAAPGITRPRRA
jgi:glutamyl-tRNA reductase